MKDIIIRFIDNLNGQWVEVSDKSNNSQCMDLAYVYIFCLGIPKSTIQHLYAHEVLTKATDFTRQYFDIIPNLKETIPQEGDLVIFKGGTAGHIAIVIEATQDKMKVFEQNSPLGTNAHISDKGYNNCLGFLRPKNVQTDAPNWIKTLLQESGLTFEDEGSFREIWTNGIKYHDDIDTLTEQVKSISQALSDRAMEVSVLTEKNQQLSREKDELNELLNKLRTDKDNLTTEKVRLEVENKDLSSSLAELQKQVDRLEANNSLYGYTWLQRLVSLFKRPKN